MNEEIKVNRQNNLKNWLYKISPFFTASIIKMTIPIAKIKIVKYGSQL